VVLQSREIKLFQNYLLPRYFFFHQAHSYYPSQRDRHFWLVPNYTTWWQRHTGVSSLAKATTQLCPARTWTRELWIASLLSCQ